MKLTIAAIGLLKTGPEKAMAADYEKRIAVLGKQAGITTIAVQDVAESRGATADLRKAEEAKWLWNTLPTDVAAIVLDERGKAWSSEEFAKLIAGHGQNATKNLGFLIGGPDGHAAETRKVARHIMSFGPMTFPHRLLRVMLLEQIYRAVTILVNHPYHRV